jgi:hypothetical protein
MTSRALPVLGVLLGGCGYCVPDPPTLVCLHDACVCPPGWYCDLDLGPRDVAPTPPFSVECAVDSFCEGGCGPACTAVKCDARATCWVQLDAGDTAACASGSQCDVTCTSNCEIYCAPDAECLLTCSGGEPTPVLGMAGCD